MFDGHCHLCSGFVQFIIRRDPHTKFHFASFSSDFAKEWFLESRMDQDTIILLENQKIYTKSDAALRIASALKGLYPLLGIFRIVPRIIRDKVYDWIATHRYQWFGKKDHCMIPTEANKKRFLS